MNQIEESKLVALVDPEMSTGISYGWYKEVKDANLNQICITEGALAPANCKFLNSMNQEIGPVERKTFVRDPFSKNVFIEVHSGLLKQLELRRWEHFAEMAHLLGAKTIKRISNEKNSDRTNTKAKVSAPAGGLNVDRTSSFCSEESIEFNRTFDNAVSYDKRQHDKACKYVKDHNLLNDPDFSGLLNARNPENTKAITWKCKYIFNSTAQSTLDLALNLDGLADLLKIAPPAVQLGLPSGVKIDRNREQKHSKEIDLEIEFSD